MRIKTGKHPGGWFHLRPSAFIGGYLYFGLTDSK
jgi:hypothetical protein